MRVTRNRIFYSGGHHYNALLFAHQDNREFFFAQKIIFIIPLRQLLNG